ncbi:protein kinase domain-containing protein [Zalerion maritima]|uniref:Protein kinase domain-containing protein n=1 Tax=Zalerion maritima TaxID=339359 RepID=A0AAD5WTL3_9PEZI|nr:protein kinase domain-containing protein [Zalerion maritima]
MAHLDSPLKKQALAEMNKRWSFLGMDLKKLTTPWRSNGTSDGSNTSPKAKKTLTVAQSDKQVDKSDRRTIGKVIPSFGRVKTFKRQQSELRDRLEPIAPSQGERRTTSADRRTDTSRRRKASEPKSQGPRASAPAFPSEGYSDDPVLPAPAFPVSLPASPSVESHQYETLKYPLLQQPLPSFIVTNDSKALPAQLEPASPAVEEPIEHISEAPASDMLTKGPAEVQEQDELHRDMLERELNTPAPIEPEQSTNEAIAGHEPLDPRHTGHDGIPVEEKCDQDQDDNKSDHPPSETDSLFDEIIRKELERKWILNLSMHFRDRSKREKFFVTYHQQTPCISAWRRVTISLDYRDAPPGSLELELLRTNYQRDKSAKIYESIRESLLDIQFYPTVTNLKLQTTNGRLHVHVVEDVNEIINYPNSRMVNHLGCRLVRESEIEFDSHMSGFVYRVRVDNRVLIKKEIPGPDTVDEFLYEVNALNQLRSCRNIIEFYGVVVDDHDDKVKGLLISYAEKGALIDIIYDHNHSLERELREKWARQIIKGLSDIHESGFVQGDFTLSNIVIDENDDAKIIDINRRGCPVGWEPPEATPLIESGQRISMYIGVKSDLFQLGMVLWALATQEDEPESHPRPLHLSASDAPRWYCRVVETCLSDDPRFRMQAESLLTFFPDRCEDQLSHHRRRTASYSVSGDDYSVQSFPNNHQSYHCVEEVNTGKPHVTPRVTTVSPPPDWSPSSPLGYTETDASLNGLHLDNGYQPMRGRSPPRDAGFHTHGVTPRYSWQDNNVATGWESRSTSPRSGVSPRLKASNFGQEQLLDIVDDVDAMPAANEISVAPVIPAMPSHENASGNTDVEQHAYAEEVEVPTQPFIDNDTTEGHQSATSINNIPHDPEMTALGLEIDVHSAGKGEVESPSIRVATTVKPAQDGLCEIGSPLNITQSAKMEANEDTTTGHNFQDRYSDPRGQPENQEPGITVPDISVEKAESQGKDSGIDTTKTIIRNDVPISAQQSAKVYESSNARAITDQIPSPKPPASPSPTRASAVRNGSDNGDSTLLNGICGNDEVPMDEKRRSALFDDLDAIVTSDVITHQVATGTSKAKP